MSSSTSPSQSLSAPSQASLEGPICSWVRVIVPLTQERICAWQDPSSLPSTISARPSSTRPSQSSSSALQISSVPSTRPLQDPHRPSEQVWVPATQEPSSVPQLRTSPSRQSQTSPSSIEPSQSSSSPLQVSVRGPISVCTVTISPLVHCRTPWVQMPSSVPLISVAKSLSTTPSQSSSRPLQISLWDP